MTPQKPDARMLVFVLALALLLVVVHVGVISITFSKLGLTRESAFLLLFFSLVGSAINVPLFTVKSEVPLRLRGSYIPGYLQQYLRRAGDRTVIAVNVGGCLIPLTFSVYLFVSQPLTLYEVMFGVTLVTLISYVYSFPVKGVGIGMPMLIAPLSAAIIAILINNELSAPLAYISGTMGVLIGADLLNFRRISQMGAVVASIGGAGTFDGIFMTGILAVLLA
ncbi:MAG: DUF1614 domain-containing protein [Thiotrichales bacterium]|nr:MAG: DUF1614 domain-containing protein [Thiotrichales bacterium]